MKLNCVIKDSNIAKNLCGIQNKNIEVIEGIFNCILDIHGDHVLTNLESKYEALILEEYMNALIEFAELGIHITLRDIVYIRKMQELGDLKKYMTYVRYRKPVAYNQNNKPVFAKTFNQAEYLKMLDEKDLIFATKNLYKNQKRKLFFNDSFCSTSVSGVPQPGFSASC